MSLKKLILSKCCCCLINKGNDVTNTNGNDVTHQDTKNGSKFAFHNPAYDESNDVSTTSSPVKPARQISDLSELYRLPEPDDGKSLSEMVFEELDKSKRDVTDDVENDVTGENDVNNEDIATGSDFNSNNNSNKDTALRGPINFKPTVTTEWRDRLKMDLDENFSDLSDSEDDPKSSEDFPEFVDESTKTSEKIRSSPTPTNRPLALQRPLVVDNGSHRVRFGWAGDFAPSATARNIVGRWRAEASEAWREALGSKFIGDVAIDRHATLNLHHPMRGGKITNWEAMRDVWDDVIDDDVDMTQHPILVTEQASIDKKQRERMAEVLFESLRFPAICLRNQSLLSAYSSNQSVSIVVNCGYDVTEVVPIYYDDVLRHAVTRMEVGGRNVGEYLAKLINLERGTNLSTTPQMELVQSIKERFASVDHDAAGAVKNGAVDKIFELSDGQTIELGSELWRCSEVLFDPTLVSSASTGIHQLVATTVSRLDPDILTETEGLIFTAGGGSGLRGLDERLEQELELLNLEKVVQVMTSDENAAWIGGSLFAEQSNFSNYCVTEDLYFEHGSPILHRMF